MKSILKENFVLIPYSEFLSLNREFREFLKNFFHINRDEFYDEKEKDFKIFVILEKKEKYLTNL